MSNASKQNQIDTYARDYKLLCSSQVQNAVDRLRKCFMTIDNLISPMLDVAYSMQHTSSDINLKTTNTTEYGTWQCEICLNASTKMFHTEKVITYTLISVPRRSAQSLGLKNKNPLFFLLKLNENKIVGIELRDDVSLLFANPGITHEQFCVDSYGECNEKKGFKLFYNIACYGNEKLYRHTLEVGKPFLYGFLPTLFLLAIINCEGLLNSFLLCFY